MIILIKGGKTWGHKSTALPDNGISNALQPPRIKNAGLFWRDGMQFVPGMES
jgi:hypothetical protein